MPDSGNLPFLKKKNDPLEEYQNVTKDIIKNKAIERIAKELVKYSDFPFSNKKSEKLINWQIITEEIRKSYIDLIRYIYDLAELNFFIHPEEVHFHWVMERRKEGWSHGFGFDITHKRTYTMGLYKHLPQNIKIGYFVLIEKIKEIKWLMNG
jgi:hypothetical protein